MKRKNVMICLSMLLALFSAGAATGEEVQTELETQNLSKMKTEPETESDIQTESLGFYFDRLDTEEQFVYSEIYYQLLEEDPDIELSSPISEDDLTDIYYDILTDHPEIFYVSPEFAMSINTETGLVETFSYIPYVEKDERKEIQAKMDEEVENILSIIYPSLSEYDKARMVFEYLAKNTTYNEEAEWDQSMASVLVNREGVCAGLSKAYKYIMNKLGMECIQANGKAGEDSMPHSWNLLKVNDIWYNVDVTWGIPEFYQPGNEYFKNVINYNYFCCDDKTLYVTHSSEDRDILPDCTDNSLDYYTQLGLFFEPYSRSRMIEFFANCIQAGQEDIVVKFGSSYSLNEMVHALDNGLVEDADATISNLLTAHASPSNLYYSADSDFYTLYVHLIY